jgi:hypothetical protein
MAVFHACLVHDSSLFCCELYVVGEELESFGEEGLRPE